MDASHRVTTNTSAVTGVHRIDWLDIMAKKPKKPTRIEKGILLCVVWLAEDGREPSVAAEMAKSWGVHNLDVTDSEPFDRDVFERLNKNERTQFHLSNAKD